MKLNEVECNILGRRHIYGYLARQIGWLQYVVTCQVVLDFKNVSMAWLMLYIYRGRMGDSHRAIEQNSSVQVMWPSYV